VNIRYPDYLYSTTMREIAIVGNADPKTERRFAPCGLNVAVTQMI